MYLQSISGVFAATRCPEMLPLPIQMSDWLNFLSTANLTLSSNGSIDFIIDFSKVDFSGANQSFLPENITTLVHISNKYCESMFQSKYLVNAYIGMSIFFCILILFGNILVLVLPYISKSFSSPIFKTLLSFSIISLIHGIDLLFYSLAQCSLVFTFELDSAFQCMLMNCGRCFIVNVRSLHLCLLACQRIYMSLFPLKARVYHTKTNVCRIIFCIYFTCVLIEFSMGFQGLRDCAVNKSIPDWSTIFKTNADFIVLNLFVVALLSAGMLLGILQKYTSPRLTLSVTQRSQSRVASIVIVLYLSFYCPLKIVVLVLQFTCVDPTYVGPIAFTASTAQFMIGALYPIMLCLRIPEAKSALMNSCCSCIANDRNNRT